MTMSHAAAADVASALRSLWDIKLQQVLDHFEPLEAVVAKQRADPQRVQYWWVHVNHAAHNDQLRWLPTLSEILALYNALARSHIDVCVQDLREVWMGERQNVGFVDPTEVFDRFERERCEYDNVGRAITSKVVFGLHWTVRTSKDLEGIYERMVGAFPPSSEYMMDYKSYMSARRRARLSAQVDPRQAHVPVAIELAVHRGAESLTLILPELLKIVVTHMWLQNDPEKANDLELAVRCRFEVVEVCVRSSNDDVISDMELAMLSALAKMGFHIRNVPAVSVQESETSRRSVVQSFNLLLPPGPGAVNSIQELTVTDNTSQDIVAGIFSAVQRSQMLRSLHFIQDKSPIFMSRGERYEREMRWRWLAYAVFSRHAQHRLNALTTDLSNFNDGALEAMRDVLEAEEPFIDLLEVDPECPRCVSATRFWLYDPIDGNHENSANSEMRFYIGHEPVIVRVIRHVYAACGEFWSVMLPGFGEAWVRQSEATMSDIPVVTPSPTVGQVTLTELSENRLANALELLRLIQRGVKCIQVDSTYSGMDRLCYHVLEICQDLEEFEVREGLRLTGLGDFISAANAGHFSLRRLSIGATLDATARDVVAFFSSLNNPSHPIGRNLQDLTLSLRFPERTWQDNLQQILDKIKRNRRLHTLTVRVANKQIALPRGANKPLVIRAGPLSMESKLSFLQCLNAHPTTRDALESTLIASIFEFAAEHRLRHIKIVHTK